MVILRNSLSVFEELMNPFVKEAMSEAYPAGNVKYVDICALLGRLSRETDTCSKLIAEIRATQDKTGA